MTTFEKAIAEIARRAPVMLDATTQHRVQDDKGSATIDRGFADDHLITLSLPAWVLRTIKETAQKTAA